MPPETTIPIYFRVAETLKARICSLHYREDEILPSEKELALEFGVSNITIRKAMALLVDGQLVVRGRGIGTRVLPQRDNRIPLKITGDFNEWMDSAVGTKHRLAVRVLEIGETPCPQGVASILKIEADSPIWRLRRIRLMGKQPVSYYTNYVPLNLLPEATVADFETSSFLDIFRRRSGIRIARTAQEVQATTADLDVAAMLGIAFGAPLFFIQNIYYSTASHPVEVTHMHFRGDRYLYRTDIEVTDPAEL